MTRPIDADALIEKSWDADTRVGYVQVVDVGDIENAPTIDPIEHNGGCYCGECRQSKWISVKDRLPDDFDKEALVVVYGKPQENITLIGAYQLASFDRDEGWILDEWPEWENPTVTHWTPLPEPPKED